MEIASTGVGDAFIASLPLAGWLVLRQVHVRYLVQQTDPAISARFVGVLLGGETADDRHLARVAAEIDARARRARAAVPWPGGDRYTS
jgi:hypothetical protein